VRTWRIESVVAVPLELIATDETGEFLPQMQSASRITRTAGVFGAAEVAVEPVELAYFQIELREPVALRFQVAAADAPAAIKAATPVVEDVVESLSFQMQQLVPVVQAEALDVTPPVEVGEEREALLFPYPHGVPLPKFQASVQLGGVATALSPAIAPLAADARTEAALGWHLKAMASPFLAEQFILNWIALEMMWRASGVSVETEYVADCGHTIGECPICKAPTAREVRGASIR
jgi:hypothetical protein